MQDDRHDCQDPRPDLTPGVPGGGRREKLGLALAGGGFRASLFHVGVLRYLARADLLRHVEVLSTVSGGSLVGALYVLHLKRLLEGPAEAAARRDGAPENAPLRLTQAQYIEITDAVEKTMRRLVGQNLRMRLLLDLPRWILISLGLASLGRHFARYLDRRLFGEISRLLQAQASQPQASGEACQPIFTTASPARGTPQLSLHALRLCGPRVQACGGTENYNRAALWEEGARANPASAVTRLILNTTSLNSSGRFWFSHAEFGEWYLGYVRHADIRTELWPRKWLLQEVRALGPADDAEGRQGPLLAALARAWCREFGEPALPDEAGVFAQLRTLWPLLRWWRRDERPLHWPRMQALADRLAAGRQGEADAAAGDGTGALTVHALATLLRDLEMGRARQLKNFAWLLRVGRLRSQGLPVRDGMSDRQLAAGFVEALKAADDRWVAALGLAGAPCCLLQAAPAGEAAPLQPWADALMLLVIEVYQCRCAEFMSPHVWQDWQDMPLAEAVAASASFPPVFPPHVLATLVDDRKLVTLGLTDGGVFDNLGSTALLDEQCTMIIASDPGGVFDTRAREVSVGRIGLMGRLVELLSERPNQLFRHELRERRRMGEAFDMPRSGEDTGAAAQFVDARALTALSTFRIAPTVEAGSPGSRGRLLSAIRTDLDVFGPLEQEALIRQGEHQAQRHLQRRFHPAAGRPLQVAPQPLPALAKLTPWQQEVLAAAAHRFWRLPRLMPGLCLLLLLLLMASAWRWPWLSSLGTVAGALWRGLDALPQGPGLLSPERLARLWAWVGTWQGLPLLALPALPLAWLCLLRGLRGRAGAALRRCMPRVPGGRRLFGQSWPTWRRRLRAVRGLLVYLLGALLLPGVLGPLWLLLPLLFSLGLMCAGLVGWGATLLYLRLAR